MQTRETLKRQNHELNQSLRRMGLRAEEIHTLPAHDPELTNRILVELTDWVQAYRQHGSRAALAAIGYLYPPVEPDCDPDNDWLLFERWLQGLPVRWNYVDTYGPLPDSSRLTEAAVEAVLGQVFTRLAERNVIAEFCDGVPARAVYEHLCRELAEARFEYLAPQTHLHLSGCTGDCDGCFQRPWCEQDLALADTLALEA